MLEKTHSRLAREIAGELKLKESESSLLELGSVRPDSFIEFPHHRGKDWLILGNILDARVFYLKSDDEAFVKLGEVFHFIADKWTLQPRTRDKHTGWEYEIDKCEFEDDPQFMQELREAIIPSNAKDFYERLCISIREFMTEKEFTQKTPLITRLIEQENIKLDLTEFLIRYAPAIETLPLLLDMHYLTKIDELERDLMPFPLLSHIAMVSREGTRADTFSTPSIDLNIASRICLAICRFVLSEKGDITFPQRILDWDNLPTNWKEILNTYIKNFPTTMKEPTKKRRFKLF